MTVKSPKFSVARGLPVENKPMNIQRRVSGRGGWIGLFTGESQGRALERILPDMNADGYRVAFIIPDKWSFARHILNIIVLVGTAGFFAHTEGLVIVGERIDSP